MSGRGRTLVVTGAGRGIGAAVARRAAADGWNVAVNYARDEAAAERVVADVVAAGRRAAAIRADVSVEGDVVALFEAAAALLGPIGGVVNNAGIVGRASPLADAGADMMSRVVDLNVKGALMVAREAARRLSTTRGGQGGAIVNVSSTAATLGAPGEYVWYAATKGAVNAMTVGLSLELAGEGVRVNAVAPGLIDTEIHAAGGQPDRMARLGPLVPLGRCGTAEEVAEAVVWLLSDAASYVTGANVRIGGGR